MKAIILAAGVGNRLKSTHDSAKCLLQFNEKSLLERHIENLNAEGVSEIHICLGHESHAIRHFLKSVDSANIICHFNPLYRLGSLVSLWTLRRVLLSDDDIILMDADVLYHPNILRQLIQSPFSNCFLLDKNYIPGAEPVKICVKRKEIIEFRKELPQEIDYDEIGESVGFFKFSGSICARLEEIISKLLHGNLHQLPHEEALRELALIHRYNVSVEDITGLPWIEIDYPEDVIRAKAEILPKMPIE